MANILVESGAPATKFCLELTESVFADDTPDLAQTMNQLRELGLYFSLDDVGTGYSFLGYLKHFPFAALKINRSFIRDVHVDPSAGPIVKAIIAPARQLKLEIVAEGIEHEAQRRFLGRGGCNAFQGYLLGPPVPIAEFECILGGYRHKSRIEASNTCSRLRRGDLRHCRVKRISSADKKLKLYFAATANWNFLEHSNVDLRDAFHGLL